MNNLGLSSSDLKPETIFALGLALVCGAAAVISVVAGEFTKSFRQHPARTLRFVARLLFWPIAIYTCLILLGNFLTAPIGFKKANLPSYLEILAWIGVAAGLLASVSRIWCDD